MPTNVQIERMNPDPLSVPRTRRTLNLRCLTSVPAGKMVPVAAWPLLREDAVAASTISIGIEMMETVELLVNPVNIVASVYLVSHLAFDRFLGMDDLNRSYMNQIPRPGATLVPFVETQAFNAGLTGGDTINSVYKYLGLQGKDTDSVNTAYLEAYNQIWNFRAKNRSPDLTLRGRLNTHLAPAFWYHEQLAMVVPDFQQAIIDGEVALNVVNANMPVHGLGVVDGATGWAEPSAINLRTPSGVQSNLTGWKGVPYTGSNMTTGNAVFGMQAKGAVGARLPDVWAELQENGITVSLSNIEMARKTQAFALLRQKYTGMTDEWIIDLLMSGVQIPDQALMQPILLAQQNTIVGMSKRYASDGDNLTKSVVNGLTELQLRISTPKVNTGGVVMVVLEATPEQLWERQRDVYFHNNDHNNWPEYIRDSLDPEKVEVVTNAQVDASHSVPNGVFGYAPMNWRWAQAAPRVGGKFYKRDASTANDANRQRIWAVETVDPTLSESFYICNNIHTKPFVDTVGDSFEATTVGAVAITGLTQFGPLLIEGSGDYEAIMAEAPQDRIDKPATTETQPALEAPKSAQPAE